MEGGEFIDTSDLLGALLKLMVIYFSLEKSKIGPCVDVNYTLPPDYKMAHWMSNLDRREAINLMRKTADKMEAQADEDDLLEKGGS